MSRTDWPRWDDWAATIALVGLLALIYGLLS